MGLVRLGRIVRAVGLKGHVGVGGSEGAIAGLERVSIRRGEGELEERKVLEARKQGRLWVVKLEGAEDRDAAEGLVGVEVLAPREALGDAGEGRHYWADLEGLPVVTVDGGAVGTVTGLYETGGVDVLVVTGAQGEKLVPMAPYVEVDRKAGRIVVDPPAGLLDLE